MCGALGGACTDRQARERDKKNKEMGIKIKSKRLRE